MSNNVYLHLKPSSFSAKSQVAYDSATSPGLLPAISRGIFTPDASSNALTISSTLTPNKMKIKEKE